MREDIQIKLLNEINGFNFKTVRFHDLDIKLKQNGNGLLDQVMEDSGVPLSSYNESYTNNNGTTGIALNDHSESSVILGKFLKDNYSLIRGQTILELGSGDGICGLYAAKLGANVILTEKEMDRINLLNENIKLNECTLHSVAIGLSPIMGLHTVPSFINIVSRPFDFIMASDLIQSSYNIESILQMFSFVTAILQSQYRSNSATNGYFLLSLTNELTIRKTVEIAERFGLKSERIISDDSSFGQLWKFEPKIQSLNF